MDLKRKESDGRRPHILIVDDEPIIRNFLERFLDREGCRTDAVENGLQGLMRLQQHRYDLILCDVKMNHMDGIEFWKEVKRKYPRLRKRVILTSGDHNGYDQLVSEGEKTIAYLAKPIKVAQLRTLLQKMLRY